MINLLYFYFSEKVKVHIDTLDNKFYNGLIIEFSDKMIIVNDRVVGEIPIMISNIKIIDKYKEVKNDWNKY